VAKRYGRFAKRMIAVKGYPAYYNRTALGWPPSSVPRQGRGWPQSLHRRRTHIPPDKHYFFHLFIFLFLFYPASGRNDVIS